MRDFSKSLNIKIDNEKVYVMSANEMVNFTYFEQKYFNVEVTATNTISKT